MVHIQQVYTHHGAHTAGVLLPRCTSGCTPPTVVPQGVLYLPVYIQQGVLYPPVYIQKDVPLPTGLSLGCTSSNRVIPRVCYPQGYLLQGVLPTGVHTSGCGLLPGYTSGCGSYPGIPQGVDSPARVIPPGVDSPARVKPLRTVLTPP